MAVTRIGTYSSLKIPKITVPLPPVRHAWLHGKGVHLVRRAVSVDRLAEADIARTTGSETAASPSSPENRRANNVSGSALSALCESARILPRRNVDT